MFQIVRKFSDELPEAATQEDVERLLGDAAARLGVTRFAYLGFGRDGTPIARSSYPREWAARYVSQRYDLIDPVPHKAAKVTLPFYWSCSGMGGDRTRRRFIAEATDFGICSGFTIPAHDGVGRTATLNFAFDSSDPPRLAERATHVAMLISTYLHHRISSIDLSQGSKEDILQPPCLSPREIECLHWARKGKSARDTATILGTKPRTVTFHLENARRKLATATTAQAVIAAARLGYLAPSVT